MQTIKVILDRFFDDSVILITESGKQILWPKDKLPEEAKLGQTLNLTLDTNSPTNNIITEKKDNAIQVPINHTKIAKAILEEILNSNEQEILK